MVTPRIGLIAFAAGRPSWRQARSRLYAQARNCSLVKYAEVLDAKALRASHPSFTAEHADHLQPRVRGFGHWLWKPYIVLSAIERFPSDISHIMYIDCGSELNYATPQSQARLAQYAEIATDEGLHIMHVPGTSEAMWTHAQVIQEFGLNRSARRSEQRSAAYLLLPRSQPAKALVDEWLFWATQEDGKWLTGSGLPAAEEPSEFRGHRHDQSLLSCLTKMRGLPSTADESYWPSQWSSRGLDYPIWTARNRSRYSVADASFASRIHRRATKVETRVWMEANWRLRARFTRRMWR
jgi:hypothetical protein